MGEVGEENHPSCRNSKQPRRLDLICIGRKDSAARGGGWSALSEAVCPAALPERTVWGPLAPPPHNPQVFDLERQERPLPLMCVCPVDTTLKTLLQAGANSNCVTFF